MKIDFKNPDSSAQIKNLQSLLEKEDPSENDIIIATLFTSLIFYENRPGKLNKLENYSIHGTGCHNPASEKTGKTRWGVLRLEVTINFQDFILIIKREHVNGGYMRAVIKKGSKAQIITADMFSGKKKETMEARSIFIKGKTCKEIMKDLHTILKEPLETLLNIVPHQVQES